MDTMPPGIPYIVGNEAAERFSYYGMKAILVVFMTSFLVASDGSSDTMTETQAREAMGWFGTGVYFFPILGAIVADAILGKYLTIILLSVVYCAGHAALALIDMPSSWLMATFEPRTWLFIGLGLIAIGSGGIKPCVTAHVGDQFGKSNQYMLERVYGWFYFSINFGSFFAYLLIPYLLRKEGAGWAFGVPGIAMAVATVFFWMGRKNFAHIQPRGLKYIKEAFTGDGLNAMLRLIPVYLFVAIFWSLYDQSATAWVLQAQYLDRDIFGWKILPDQVGSVNPLLIMLFIPLFAYLIYPWLSKIITLTSIRKIGIGFVLTAMAFGLSAVIEQWTMDARHDFGQRVVELHEAGDLDYLATAKLSTIDGHVTAAGHAMPESAHPKGTLHADAANADLMKLAGLSMAAGEQAGPPMAHLVDIGFAVSDAGEVIEVPELPTIWWQMLAYVILTAGEVMVSITCLEFSYTQAPKQMKSLILGLYLLSVSAGNFITAMVNRLTTDAQGNSTLIGADYYWFFTKLMLGAIVVYCVVGRFFKSKTYMQDEETT
jgi:dipeptide/tripeptide permease